MAYIDSSVLNPFIMALIFGAVCGMVITIVTGSAGLKITVYTRITGVVSVIATDIIISISGIPYKIILYKYRNTAFVQETGRITINESLVFGWSNMFFWCAMAISFIVVVVSIFIYKVVKNRRIKKQARSTPGSFTHNSF